MATLMKCTQPHWQGNTFVPHGTVYPEGHHAVVAEFFEPFEIDETPPPTLQDRARELGVKRVGTKSDDTLAAEIAAIEAGQTSAEDEGDEPDGADETE